MTSKLALGVVLALTGCLKSSSLDCGDYVCPADTVCAVELHQCLTDDQTTVCSSLPEGERCTANGNAGICTAGYCIAGCGDGVSGADEECDDGNFASHDGCSSTCRLESLTWHEVHDPWTPISGAAVAHLNRNGGTLVRFGGYDASSSTNTQWERNAGAWTRITTGLPPARHYTAYGYDSTRDVLVLFGGTNGPSNVGFDETWEYDGTGWKQITTNGKPSPRWGAAMAFDPTRNVFVLFGGFAPATTTLLGDTWEYTPATKTWTSLTLATKPSARFWQSMTWDATAQRVVLFGGIGGNQQAWKYDGTNHWVPISGVGPASRPSPGMAYSPILQRVVLYGGRGGAVTDVDSDTWQLDTTAGTWAPVDPSLSPPGRYEHAMVYDPETTSITLFGGFTGNAILDDVWSFDGNRWSDKTPRYAPGNPQIVQLTYDSARSRAVAYGYDRSTNMGQIWEFDGTTWSPVPNATRSPHTQYAIAYDAVRGKTVMFGGYLQGSPLQQTTWEWDGKAFSDFTGASPPARYFGVMTQAGPNGGVVLHGGYLDNASVNIAHDTWIYDGASWREIPTPDELPAEGVPMMTYDMEAKRVVLLTHDSATWVFENETWTRLSPAVSPPPRSEGALVYRRDRGKTMLYGGRGYTDVWEFDGTTWRELQLIGERPPERAYAGAAYHEHARSLVMFGGGTLGGGILEDTWLLQYESLTGSEICDNAIDDDGDKHVDRDDPDCN